MFRGKVSMKLAFDWGMSLQTNESLRQLARDAVADGHKVYILPALPIGDPMDYEGWCDSNRVPYHAICRVRFPAEDESVVPAMKVEMMRAIGCTVLFDNDDRNLEAAREAGIEAVKIVGNNPIEWCLT